VVVSRVAMGACGGLLCCCAVWRLWMIFEGWFGDGWRAFHCL